MKDILYFKYFFFGVLCWFKPQSIRPFYLHEKNRINCGLSFCAQNCHDNNHSLLKQNKLLIVIHTTLITVLYNYIQRYNRLSNSTGHMYNFYQYKTNGDQDENK